MRRNNIYLLFGLLFLLSIILFVLDVIFGSVSIPLAEFKHIIFGGGSASKAYELIIFQSRIPKALTAILCGIALSLSGLQMQALFRNPLAGPYILGVSNGAGLGVAVLVMAGGFLGITAYSDIGISMAAMLGAGLILFFVFLFSLKIKDIMTVLIVGIMLGSITSAIIGLIQYTSTEAALKKYLIWSLGSLEGLSYQEITILAVCVLAGVLLMLQQVKNLNLLLLGESYAKSLGMNVKFTRIVLISSTSLMAGSVTAFCGPIGFIGIVVPHICRVMFNTSNHFVLFPACCLLGSCILLLSDLLSHFPGSEMILPINSITSILGIPVILWIIIGRKTLAQAF